MKKLNKPSESDVTCGGVITGITSSIFIYILAGVVVPASYIITSILGEAFPYVSLVLPIKFFLII